MNFFKLIYILLFKRKKPRLDGSVLFSDEYSNDKDFSKINSLFLNGNQSIIRLPIQGNNIQSFLKCAKIANDNNIEILALLDSYENDKSMMNRLNSIKINAPYIKYFQIFNELPHMIDLYPGEKINSLQELLEKTNKYSDWIHSNISNSKVVSMSTYNSLDERSWGIWENVTNTRILKDLILYTAVDVCGIHLYGDSFGKKLDLVELSGNITKWKKEAKSKGFDKKIWVTECGVDSWKKHVSYYDKMIKLFKNTVDPEKIIWYRQCTKTSTEEHYEFAIETLDNNKQSPLFNHLIKKQ